MAKRDDYRAQLERAKDVPRFLRMHSGLPGPRANLELLEAAADVGDLRAFRVWIAAGSGEDPTDEYLVMCGVVGLGRLVADGQRQFLKELRDFACDSRWRVREAVAIGLQRVGDADMNALFSAVAPWAKGEPYVQRAAAAAVCEPRLLKVPGAARRAIDLLDAITKSFARTADRRSDEFRVLRQALAYCWSVAVAADPAHGKPAFERWTLAHDPDIRWIMRENLKKQRLIAMDRAWTARLTKG